MTWQTKIIVSLLPKYHGDQTWYGGGNQFISLLLQDLWQLKLTGCWLRGRGSTRKGLSRHRFFVLIPRLVRAFTSNKDQPKVSFAWLIDGYFRCVLPVSLETLEEACVTNFHLGLDCFGESMTCHVLYRKITNVVITWNYQRFSSCRRNLTMGSQHVFIV